MFSLKKIYTYLLLILFVILPFYVVYGVNISIDIPAPYKKNIKEGAPIIQQGETFRVYIHITKEDINDSFIYLNLKNLNNNKLLRDEVPVHLTQQFTDVIWTDILLSDIGEQTIELSLFEKDSNNPIILERQSFSIISDIDSDSDNIFDSEDLDDDNDGLTDIKEILFGSNPLIPDSDYDGLSDSEELDLKLNPNSKDTDGDGVHDIYDGFPLDKTEYLDTDGDGIGDNKDSDTYPEIKNLEKKLLPQNTSKNIHQENLKINKLENLKNILEKDQNQIYLSKNIQASQFFSLTQVNKTKNNFNILSFNAFFYWGLYLFLFLILFIIFGFISRPFKKRRKK